MKQLWERVLERIRSERKISSRNYKNWFADTAHHSFDDDLLRVKTPSETIAHWLQTQYLSQVTEAVEAEVGRPIRVEFLHEDPDAPRQTSLAIDDTHQLSVNEAAIAEQTESLATTGIQRAPLIDWYTFDNYVSGPTNEFAYNAAQAIAESPGQVYNPLFMHGSVGIGKTHLLHAIGNGIRQQFPHKRILYATCESFTNDFIRCVREKKMSSFQKHYRSIDVLLIDDIHFLSRTKATQEEFFHTFNELYLHNKQIVMTSDRPVHELATLEERLRSRFEHGLIIDIEPPIFEMRVAILHTKAERLDMPLPVDVAMFMANMLTLNVRQLEGCLTNLFAKWSLRRQPITLPLAREVMANYITEGKREITVKGIVDRTAEVFRITPEDLVSSSRKQPIALARQAAMFLTHELTSLSSSEIARAFGKKDHSTVLHAVRKIRESMGEDDILRTKVEDIRTSLLED